MREWRLDSTDAVTSSIVQKNLQRMRAVLHNPAIAPAYLYWWVQDFFGREPILAMMGHRFTGFPDFNAFLGTWHYRPNKTVRAFIERQAAAATVVVDAGANFGVFTSILARAAPDARIYAFEPHPKTHAALLRNLPEGSAHRIETPQLALGRANCEIGFSDHAPQSNRITASTNSTITVRQTRLSDFCDETGIEKIDFIKIDVEGAELDLLDGAAELFAEGQVVAGMIELCPGNLSRFGQSVDNIIDWFAARGYQLCEFGPDGCPGSPIQRGLVDQTLLTDACFVRKAD